MGGSTRWFGVAALMLAVYLAGFNGRAGADDTQTISISPATITVSEADGTVTFTVALSDGPDSATVDYTTQDGTATSGEDYTATSGSLTEELAVPAGGTRTITVPILNGDRDEPEQESFTVKLSNPSGAILGTDTGTATVTDDDPAPNVSIGDVTVTEGNSGTVNANFPVTLSAVSGKAVTIGFSTGEGTAESGVDYVSRSNESVTIPANQNPPTATITIAVRGDVTFEPNEFFFVNIFGTGGNATIVDAQGRGTITDDDSSPTPTVPNAAVAEGNSATTALTFQVTLSSPRPAVTFNYRTVAGTANGADFTEVGGAPLVFPASTGTAATTLPVTIQVAGDVLDENDESFLLQLVNPTTGVVVASATGTITNDDNNSRLSISDATADEPSTGAATMRFTITLSAISGRTVGVSWATANGTATAGVDYTAGSGVLSFAPGETSKNVEVSVIGDTVNEENETLMVNLSGEQAAAVSDRQAQGTIIDKNAPPSLSISDTLASEGSGASFTVTLAGTTLRTVTVRFSTGDGFAKAGSDYVARTGTLTFASGEKTKAVEVTVVDDAAAEEAEDFVVSLDDPVNGTISKNVGRALIEASDRVDAPTPTPTPTPKPTAKPAAVLTPRMILGPRTVSVGANGVARMLVNCHKVSPIGCAGTVELERAVKPLLKLGKKTFSVKKGAKGYASIKLTSRALTILRKNRTLRVKVVVLVKTSAKTLKVSPGIITLKGTKAFLTAKPKPPAKPKQPTTKVLVDP